MSPRNSTISPISYSQRQTDHYVLGRSGYRARGRLQGLSANARAIHQCNPSSCRASRCRANKTTIQIGFFLARHHMPEVLSVPLCVRVDDRRRCRCPARQSLALGPLQPTMDDSRVGGDRRSQPPRDIARRYHRGPTVSQINSVCDLSIRVFLSRLLCHTEAH